MEKRWEIRMSRRVSKESAERTKSREKRRESLSRREGEGYKKDREGGIFFVNKSKCSISEETTMLRVFWRTARVHANMRVT